MQKVEKYGREDGETGMSDEEITLGKLRTIRTRSETRSG